MRIEAERERIVGFKNLIVADGKHYYKIIQTLFDSNSEITALTYFIMDYMKSVIESGVPFDKTKLFFVIQQLDRDTCSDAVVE